MNTIFIKTEKGRQEMEHKGGELSPRIRRLLIMIDGKRTFEDLKAFCAADDLTHSLSLLEESGFIELANKTIQVSKPIEATPIQKSITAFRKLPQEFDPLAFTRAKNFMNNTLNAFVGIGASTLMTRVEGATTHEHLRTEYDEWYHAIVASRDGRREAETLRIKLLEII